MTLDPGEPVYFVDSCNHYTNVATKYPDVTSPIPTIASGVGHTEPGSILFDAGGGFVPVPGGSDGHVLGVGYYAYIDAASYSGLDSLLWRVHEFGGGVVTTVVADSSGRFVIRDGDRGTVLYQSATSQVPLQTWFAFEARCNQSGGTLSLYIDHTLLSTETPTFTSVLSTHDIGNDLPSVDWYIDDLYTASDVILQPWQVISHFPQGAGEFAQWDDQGSTPNYACVDDLSVPDDADSDDDWVQVVGTGSGGPFYDTYDFGDLPAGVDDVYAVQFNTRSAGVSLGPEDYAHVQQYEAGSGGLYLLDGHPIDDDRYTTATYNVNNSASGGTTVAPWTVEEVNDYLFGIGAGSISGLTVKIAQMAMEFLVTAGGVVSTRGYGYITKGMPFSPFKEIVTDGGVPVTDFLGRVVTHFVDS